MNYILNSNQLETSLFEHTLREKYSVHLTDESLNSVLGNLNFEFVKKPKKIVSIEIGRIKLEDGFQKLMEDQLFKDFIKDSICYSIHVYNQKFKVDKYNHGFLISEKYSRKDACRILNWPTDISSVVYGYKTVNGVTPCFVTYKKSDSISNSTQYNDHFIDPQTFAWESRSNRRIESSEIQNVINSELILLFVKKSDGEGTDFYCIGEVEIVPGSIKQDKMSVSEEPVVHFKYSLKHRVEDHLYEYLTEEG